MLIPCLVLISTAAALSASDAGSAGELRFEARFGRRLPTETVEGRMFFVLARTKQPEPRLLLGRTGADAPQALALDVDRPSPGASVVLDEGSFSFPLTNPAAIPSGDYFVQALFDYNRDLRLPNAPGNLYSATKKIVIDPGKGQTIKLDLSEQ